MAEGGHPVRFRSEVGGVSSREHDSSKAVRKCSRQVKYRRKGRGFREEARAVCILLTPGHEGRGCGGGVAEALEDGVSKGLKLFRGRPAVTAQHFPHRLNVSFGHRMMRGALVDSGFLE